MLDRRYYLKKQRVPFWFLYMTLPSGCLLKLGFLSIVLQPSYLMHTTRSHLLISTPCFLSSSILVFSTSTWKPQQDVLLYSSAQHTLKGVSLLYLS